MGASPSPFVSQQEISHQTWFSEGLMNQDSSTMIPIVIHNRCKGIYDTIYMLQAKIRPRTKAKVWLLSHDIWGKPDNDKRSKVGTHAEAQKWLSVGVRRTSQKGCASTQARPSEERYTKGIRTSPKSRAHHNWRQVSWELCPQRTRHSEALAWTSIITP